MQISEEALFQASVIIAAGYIRGGHHEPGPIAKAAVAQVLECAKECHAVAVAAQPAPAPDAPPVPLTVKEEKAAAKLAKEAGKEPAEA